MTLDIAKFHRTCPILPAHKQYFVVQGSNGFFIDHCCPFGCASSEGNAGSIANAAMDIWEKEKVAPAVKWVDDLNVFRFPSAGNEALGFSYPYDMASAKKLIEPLSIPWHKTKWSDFASIFVYIGIQWDIENKRASLPEHKRLKFLHRVRQFIDLYSNHPVLLAPTLSLQGSLVHISFVYLLGSSHLPSIFSFASSFNENRYSRRYPTSPMIRDLKWWETTLSEPGLFRSLQPKGPRLGWDISVDASTDWGIGVVVNGKWDAWSLRPGWKSEGRNIGWLEALAVEFLVYILEANDLRDVTIPAHSDNQGVIGAFEKGRSRSVSINLSIQRSAVILTTRGISLSLSYIESAKNPADPISRGDLGLPEMRLKTYFQLPDELTPFICHV